MGGFIANAIAQALSTPGVEVYCNDYTDGATHDQPQVFGRGTMNNYKSRVPVDLSRISIDAHISELERRLGSESNVTECIAWLEEADQAVARIPDPTVVDGHGLAQQTYSGSSTRKEMPVPLSPPVSPKYATTAKTH